MKDLDDFISTGSNDYAAQATYFDSVGNAYMAKRLRALAEWARCSDCLAIETIVIDTFPQCPQKTCPKHRDALCEDCRKP